MRLIDVRHLGRERVIGSWLVDGCLIDCGPSSSLDGLLEGLGDERPERLLLTHIHLDHAGGAGKLVERWPDLEVWVHERGAKHVEDPEKLVASATRLYGEDMERLWGEIVPVPAANLRVLAGGESIDGWQVAYTPGHASHHVSFLHEASRTAFCGDTAGVRLAPSEVLLAPTPPPDVDLEAWPDSLDAIAAWRPERVALTHFGAFDDVDGHLAALRETLDQMVGWANELGDRDAFSERVRAHIGSQTDTATADAYEQAMPADTLYPGLERALRRVDPPQS